MTKLNCEYVRDVYPDALHGRMDPELAQRIRDHVSHCEDCAGECALVAGLHAQLTAVPAGLEQRVVSALRQPRRPLIRPAQLALAATVAAALIGGSMLLDLGQRSPVRQAAPGRVQPPIHVGAVGVDATMLSGKTSLEDLSVEQLEKLLGEMES